MGQFIFEKCVFWRFAAFLAGDFIGVDFEREAGVSAVFGVVDSGILFLKGQMLIFVGVQIDVFIINLRNLATTGANFVIIIILILLLIVSLNESLPIVFILLNVIDNTKFN